jgi:hypothetical protein
MMCLLFKHLVVVAMVFRSKDFIKSLLLSSTLSHYNGDDAKVFLSGALYAPNGIGTHFLGS